MQQLNRNAVVVNTRIKKSNIKKQTNSSVMVDRQNSPQCDRSHRFNKQMMRDRERV